MGYQLLNKAAGCILLLLLFISTQAQYYYSDLIATELLENKQSLYRQGRVKRINETAILPNGERQVDYRQWSTISAAGDTLQQIRVEPDGSIRTTFIYDRGGKLKELSETQPTRLAYTTYARTENGQIRSIAHSLQDNMMDLKTRETHVWEYDNKGKPFRMWRMVEQPDQNVDSAEVKFILDSSGQVAEERVFKKGKEFDFFYYYYNEQGQITDIVRYHPKWKKLLPDQLFEYGTDGKLLQRMQLTGNRELAYLVWRYSYESGGMVKEESLYNNQKQPTGSIRFSYEYYQPK